MCKLQFCCGKVWCSLVSFLYKNFIKSHYIVFVIKFDVLQLALLYIFWIVYRKYCLSVAYPGIFFEGVQQIQLRTEDGKKGYLGAIAS